MKQIMLLHLQRKRRILKINYEIIQKNELFSDMELSDIKSLLQCLNAKTAEYKKNDFILLQSEPVNLVGIVLSGRINIMKEDFEGNINILAKLGESETFAEAFACAGIKESPVTVQADENCQILFIDWKKIITTCPMACKFHTKIIGNMIRLIAKKNIVLNQKIEILSKRTIREKLLMFFEIQSRSARSRKFAIPYNRETLANYLCIDRSAMSRELCKMREEGIILFHKNEFEFK
jgi:CRP-like cAMP-binding protein